MIIEFGNPFSFTHKLYINKITLTVKPKKRLRLSHRFS